MAKKGQTFNQYSEDLKREAIQLYKFGESSREVARQLIVLRKGKVLALINQLQKGKSFEDKSSMEQLYHMGEIFYYLPKIYTLTRSLHCTSPTLPNTKTNGLENIRQPLTGRKLP